MRPVLSPRARLAIVNLAVWGGLAAAPLVLDAWQTGQLAQYLSYGLFAMSLALIWGQCGMLSFGHAVFFGLGAYAMSLVTLGKVPGLGSLATSYAGVLAAVLVSAAAANLLGRFLFYGRGLRGAYLAIVMLAVAVVAERLAVNWDYIGGLNGLSNVPPMDLGLFGGVYQIWEGMPLYYFALAVAFVVYLLLEGLARSRYGIVLRAIRDSEARTGYFGYDTAAYKLTAFTVAAAVAGLAGAIFVTQFGFASPPLIGFALSTEVLIWVAVGGRTVLLAAFLGAILVRTVESYLTEALGPYWLLALGLMFVAVVLFLPHGLIGQLMLTLSRRRPTGA